MSFPEKDNEKNNMEWFTSEMLFKRLLPMQFLKDLIWCLKWFSIDSHLFSRLHVFDQMYGLHVLDLDANRAVV